MVSPEEVAAWSIDELRAEILHLLPTNWQLGTDENRSGYWTLKIYSFDDDQNPVIELEKENADLRLALLDVFGWLWFKKMPQPSQDSPWVRKNDPTVASVTRRAQRINVPDPEDLDPEEIARVHKSRK